MMRGKNSKYVRAFTLPTVIITSLVMMSLLVAALQIISTTRQALEDQYYGQIAREAAEAGGTYIAECMRQGTYTTNPLTPKTNCTGGSVSAQQAHVIRTSRYESTFTARYESNGTIKETLIVGTVNLLRPDGSTQKTYTHNLKQSMKQEMDETATRASKRWWHFGNAVLDFGTSGTIRSIGGASSGNPPEGITTVSDRQGNLLFYSDGLSVWNRNHALMTVSASAVACTDGTARSGQGLCGSRTGTQAVASFPINSSETKYVIVTSTVNAQSGGNKGTLYMSIIDFGTYADGRIILRNQPVWPGTDNYAYEGLNARPLATGVGGVVHAYNRDRTYSFRITNSGTDTSVTLNVTRLAQRTFSPSMATWVCSGSGTGVPFGSVNFNRDYTRMAIVLGGSGCTDSANAGRFILYDIDTTTDVITERANVAIGHRITHAYTSRAMGYSADFSPSGNYLYVTKIYPGELYRYDVASNNATTIKNSEWFIGNTNCQRPGYSVPYVNCVSLYQQADANSYPYEDRSPWGAGVRVDGGGQVLRGPDDRMYVANRGSQYIGVINNPDAVPATVQAIGWSRTGVNLGAGNYSMYGLPQMVSLYSPKVWQY